MFKVQSGLQPPSPAAGPPLDVTVPSQTADAGAFSPRSYGDSYGGTPGPETPLSSPDTEQAISLERPSSGSSHGEASTPSSPDVSIILASLNERENLPELIARIEELGIGSYELIVVDDGSTDGTREYVVALAQRDRRIRSILNDSRQTLTIAHLQGILASRGRYVVVMDSDQQHPPETVPRMLQKLRSGADLVVGSRYLPGGSVGRRTAFRGLMSRVATRIARTVLFETRTVTDPISGFFGFRRAVFVPFDPRYRGYETLLFMLVMCEGRPIAEVGYEFQARSSGNSKITQDFGFVPMFLTQLMLATRFRHSLRRSRGVAPERGAPRDASPSIATDAEPGTPARVGGLIDGPT